ncbi:hypothetical protein ACIBG0_33620 [Nocardia sp. NPDC050630]|uniref:hypothetical protein n=1 Tax=Nocardia sp. NPDC050630 TaxID=3364321 RepID=UPI0037A44211
MADLVLCGDAPGAWVTDVVVTGGDDGTSSRRALRVSYNDVGHEAGLPTHLFLKSTATFGSRILLGITGIATGKSIFYNRIRPDLDVRSPRAYYSKYDAKSHRSLVLLED